MSCDVDQVTEGLENELWRSRAHSPSFQSLHLRHSSFSNPSIAFSTSQLIHQPLRCFTLVTAHSLTLSSPFSTSQLVLQPFRHFTYVTAHSPTLVWLVPRHRLFTYVTWRAAHSLHASCTIWYSIKSKQDKEKKSWTNKHRYLFTRYRCKTRSATCKCDRGCLKGCSSPRRVKRGVASVYRWRCCDITYSPVRDVFSEYW